jgi:hypothetical protein
VAAARLWRDPICNSVCWLNCAWFLDAVEQVGVALGKSPEQVHRLRQEAIELNRLDEIFAVA